MDDSAAEDVSALSGAPPPPRAVLVLGAECIVPGGGGASMLRYDELEMFLAGAFHDKSKNEGCILTPDHFVF